MNANCVGNQCGSLNGTYEMNWTSTCSWKSATKFIGFCTNCGDSVRAQLGASAGTVFGPPTCNANYCRWTLTLTHDASSDACNDYGITYTACFLKTSDPLADKVLNFESASTDCKSFPATITITAIAC